MWPFPTPQQYRTVAADDIEEEAKAQYRDQQPIPTRSWIPLWRIIGGTVAAVIFALILAGAIVYLAHHGSIDSEVVELLKSHDPQDQNTKIEAGCPRRQEWRALSRVEQHDYISAVLCLQTKSSALSPQSNYTAYDDFPWLHAHVGYATHHSAPFLPWHRYFLHIYEDTLRLTCGYTGSLVYWDWTLDYQALEKSPVFNPNTGFGGDGDVHGESKVGRSGRCVVDGPFAGTEVPFYDIKYQPHCLSRGFRDLEGNLGHINGEDISPEAIEEVLNAGSYQEFVEKMESKVHDVIPFGIAGDFETFTAPYDPIFFLHHTQLDRLWWIWQQRQPDMGLLMYSGHKERHSMEAASLDDNLQYRNLAAQVKAGRSKPTVRRLGDYNPRGRISKSGSISLAGVIHLWLRLALKLTLGVAALLGQDSRTEVREKFGLLSRSLGEKGLFEL